MSKPKPGFALSSEDMDRVLEFFKIDHEWFAHLLDRDFNCGCEVHAEYIEEPLTYCEEWELVRRVRNAKIQVELAEDNLNKYLNKYLNEYPYHQALEETLEENTATYEMPDGSMSDSEFKAYFGFSKEEIKNSKHNNGYRAPEVVAQLEKQSPTTKADERLIGDIQKP
jgi:hypothetical protein